MLQNKSIEFFINIGSYCNRYIILRIMWTSLTAVFLIFLAGYMNKWELLPQEMKLPVYTIAVLGFNSVTEFNLFMIWLFVRKQWLAGKYYLQISIIILFTLLLPWLWVKLAEKLLGEVNILSLPVTQIILVIGLLIVTVHILLVLLSNLTKNYMESRQEVEKLTQAKLENDYNQLRDRLNPHFLFNNLSVLKSLIRYNPEEAEKFTDHFTQVYRYVLKCHDHKTIALEEEMKFLDSYIALHKERIGDYLQVDIRIDEEDKCRFIPPLSVQLLIENAIKHNAANKNHRLNIMIQSKKGGISVENNLNKKETTYSTQTGLKALNQQYLFFCGKAIVITETENSFNVWIPFI